MVDGWRRVKAKLATMTYFEKEELSRLAAERDVRTADGWKKLLREERPMTLETNKDLSSWVTALAAAKKEVARIMAEDSTAWNDVQQNETALMLAENRMVDALCVPPHWKKTVWCKSCGPMPYSEEVRDALACPWCGVVREVKRVA